LNDAPATIFAFFAITMLLTLLASIIYGVWAYRLLRIDYGLEPNELPQHHPARVYWVMALFGIFFYEFINSAWWGTSLLFEYNIVDRYFGVDLSILWFQNSAWWIIARRFIVITSTILALHAYCMIAFNRSRSLFIMFACGFLWTFMALAFSLLKGTGAL
jgi:hypothetical protein